VTDEQNPHTPPSLRASNADREQVARVLQQAMSEGRITVEELESRLDSVYGAKTLAELEPVVRDLPGHHVSLAKNASVYPISADMPVSGALSVSASGPARGNLVAVMSGVERKGIWTAAAHINAVALMGGMLLDFTQCRLSAMETVMNVTAIMGGIDIKVPAGMTVIVDGVGIMGAFEDNANQQCGPEAPVLRITGVAIMGGVNVKGPKKSVSG
jgi:hypothetical protein